MSKSLLFIPDISGFTKFVQNTEIEHSQHVIAELLEILIAANTQDLQLAEIEGDALFFYKESSIPSQEKLLAQVETMFTAFYSHLKLLEKNRICPCNACAMAPELELKIIIHCGDIQFINVQNNKKPFGQAVIQAHRLLKNNIDSDHYVLISNELAHELKIPLDYRSRLFNFRQDSENYDDKEIKFMYSDIDKSLLKLIPFEAPKVYNFDRDPNIEFSIDINTSAETVLETITNYKYRDSWVNGVDKFVYNEYEVTRVGSEHTCVINGKHFNFKTITKEVKEDELVYGELTESPPPIDQLYQFYIIKPLENQKCRITAEIFWIAKSPIKKLLLALFVKKQFTKNIQESLTNLKSFVEKIQ